MPNIVGGQNFGFGSFTLQTSTLRIKCLVRPKNNVQRLSPESKSIKYLKSWDTLITTNTLCYYHYTEKQITTLSKYAFNIHLLLLNTILGTLLTYIDSCTKNIGYIAVVI